MTLFMTLMTLLTILSTLMTFLRTLTTHIVHKTQLRHKPDGLLVANRVQSVKRTSQDKLLGNASNEGLVEHFDDFPSAKL